ncbi:hypothetical protein KAR91_33210 [Candidatus Pacearchaeota archaeon]|nr:hypothetical protein [Candidatus Pacearchaeota archaeon]
MPIVLLKSIIAAGGSFVSIAISGLVKLLVSEKVVMRITMSLGKKLVKSTKNTLDDDFLRPIEEAYEQKNK